MRHIVIVQGLCTKSFTSMINGYAETILYYVYMFFYIDKR